MIDGLRRRITEEPVMTQAVIQAGIAMLVGFGLSWTADQVALVLAFTAMLLSFIARQQVTPTAKFDQAVNREAENIAEAIVTDRAAPLTDEERATLDQLRAERDRLRAQHDARRLAVQSRRQTP